MVRVGSTLVAFSCSDLATGSSRVSVMPLRYFRASNANLPLACHILTVWWFSQVPAGTQLRFQRKEPPVAHVVDEGVGGSVLIRCVMKLRRVTKKERGRSKRATD